MNWNVILYIVINGVFFLLKYVWNCFLFEKIVDFKVIVWGKLFDFVKGLVIRRLFWGYRYVRC